MSGTSSMHCYMRFFKPKSTCKTQEPVPEPNRCTDLLGLNLGKCCTALRLSISCPQTLNRTRPQSHSVDQQVRPALFSRTGSKMTSWRTSGWLLHTTLWPEVLSPTCFRYSHNNVNALATAHDTLTCAILSTPQSTAATIRTACLNTGT
jgi:hypothetical protein